MSEKKAHQSYWLYPEVVKSPFRLNRWFSLAFSRSRVQHHFEHKGDDLLCAAVRRGVTLNLRNRIAFAIYVESQQQWTRSPRAETEMFLAVPLPPQTTEETSR